MPSRTCRPYLNGHLSYDRPPTYDVTVEEFETSALDRLRILAEIESSAARNRTGEELRDFIGNQCRKYMPLSPNERRGEDGTIRDAERKRDHLSHFVLRLAFCRSYVYPHMMTQEGIIDII